MTETAEPSVENNQPLSLGTQAARNLTTTTKSVPQMQGITSRWLLRVLPWVEARGGVYRVNRRVTYTLGDGRLTFVNTGADVQVVPEELRELPALRTFDNSEILAELAQRFAQAEFQPGELVVTAGEPIDQVFLLVHGKVNKVGSGEYDDGAVLATLIDGDHFGAHSLVDSDTRWTFSVRALTRTTVLALPRQSFDTLVARSDALRAHLDAYRSRPRNRQNRHGEADIDVSSGHDGEPDLTGTFVDYELSPREYELSVAQTVLRVHSRVADLYNEPMDQVEQQLRLTIEALRERQEHEMLNNRQFGLLHNADLQQRIPTRTGPPTPDDLDTLLSRRRKTQYLLAHPQAIAAFRRECTARRIYPSSSDVQGHRATAWRGVPLLPCTKIPVSDTRTSSIIAMRTGEHEEGVIGLHQTGLPDEYQPGLSVRFMGINEKAIISYLVSTYYSTAVLVPDALGVLENVEIGR